MFKGGINVSRTFAKAAPAVAVISGLGVTLLAPAAGAEDAPNGPEVDAIDINVDVTLQNEAGGVIIAESSSTTMTDEDFDAAGGFKSTTSYVPSFAAMTNGTGTGRVNAPTAAGCGTVKISMVERSVLAHTVVFEYTHTKSFCWGYNQGWREVSRVSWDDDVPFTTWGWLDSGRIDEDAGFYGAWTGKNGVVQPKSGHFSWSKRQITQTCGIVPFICAAGKTPSIRLNVFADGSYWYDVVN